MLGTGKTYRSRVEAIADSGLLPNYVSRNIDKEYFASFTSNDVRELSDEECRLFIMTMDTIGCHCCKEESMDVIFRLVTEALAAHPAFLKEERVARLRREIEW